jgi:transposase
MVLMSRPIHVRPLSAEESAALDRLVRSNCDGRKLRRAQMVRLSSLGYKCHQIAELIGVSIPCVTKALHRFNREGLGGLDDLPRPGRPSKAKEDYIQLLKEAVSTSPRDLGYGFSSWSLARLREHLFRQTRVLLSPPHLSRLMARNNIVYRRPRHVMSHLRDQAEYDEKKAFLEFVKKTPWPARPDSISSSSTSVRFTSTRP